MYDKSPGDLVQLVHHLEATTASANQIKIWTDRDPILSQVKKFQLQGSPELQHVSDEFKPYQSRSDELSLLDGCVLWGTRVVVPPQGRQSVLMELHETHPGVSKMKSLARSYTWWLNMNNEIEEVVTSRLLKAVKQIVIHQLLLSSIHGNGQINHGTDYMLILRVQ